MRVRPASPDDEALILAWANDPAARAAGFQAEPIEPDIHHRWFSKRLARPAAGRIWIGLDDGDERPIGVVRAEMAGDGALVVSITLDPAERGLGTSRPLLEAGLAAARTAFPGKQFRAWIRPDNRPSLALFRGAGFVPPQRSPTVAPAGADPDAVILELDDLRGRVSGG